MMDEDTSNSARRMSTRTRRVAPKMVAALASNDNRTQVCDLIYILLCSYCICWIVFITSHF